jgi:hypothetical protein
LFIEQYLAEQDLGQLKDLHKGLSQKVRSSLVLQRPPPRLAETFAGGEGLKQHARQHCGQDTPRIPRRGQQDGLHAPAILQES